MSFSATGPGARHGGRRRARRGSTLVFVALFSVALVGLAAFAIDISRLYVGVNELQTGADATALRGALYLQRSPGTDGAAVMTSFATSNEALGQPVAIANGDIESGQWLPATRTFTAYAWSDARVNAVRVSARRSTGLLLGRVLNRLVAVPERKAVAWVANVTGVDCIKPWGMDRAAIEAKIGVDLTTQAGINALKDLQATDAGKAQLTVVFSADVKADKGATEPDGKFQALTDQGSSSQRWESLMVGAGCGDGNSEFSVSDINAQPGEGNQIIGRSDAIVRQTNTEKGPCKKGLTPNDATCYDPAQPGYVAGPTIVVALTNPVGKKNDTDIAMLSRFRLMCAFTDDAKGAPSKPSTEVCPWLTTVGRTNTGYLRGTIVGYAVGGFADLGPGSELGNTLSTGQRLILVR
jgi:Flp pilus assembly protein TadG